MIKLANFIEKGKSFLEKINSLLIVSQNTVKIVDNY